MKTLLPSHIIDVINSAIDFDPRFITSPEKTKFKAKQICINLWYFIYSSQIDNFTKKEDMGITIGSNFWVNINSSLFNNTEYSLYHTKQYGYNTFLEILANNKLIEINTFFSPTNFSKSYRICSFKGTKNFTYINVDTDIIFSSFKSKKEYIKEYPKYKHLIEDCYKTKIDINLYAKFLMANLNRTIAKLGTRTITTDNGSFKITCERILDEEKIISLLHQAIKINLGNLWFSVSDEGRFYSSFTNLSHLASSFMTYNKEKLIGLDIKNCQPLLLNILINNQDLKEATEDGTFYNKIQDYLNISRDEVKRLCYRYIFFNNDEVKSGKLMTAIDKLYPGLVSQINLVKKDNKLAQLLQTIESDIIINNVGLLVIPKITKHDEVFTTNNYITELKKFMVEYIYVKYKLKVNTELSKGTNNLFIIN